MKMFLVNYTDIETDKYKMLCTNDKEPMFFETEEEAIQTARITLPKETKFYIFEEIDELHKV